MQMKVYEIDDGATYWVAAKNIRQATEIFFEGYEERGELMHMQDLDSLTVEEVPPEKASKVMIKFDGEDRVASAASLAIAEGPSILGCSEWP